MSIIYIIELLYFKHSAVYFIFNSIKYNVDFLICKSLDQFNAL